MTHPVMRRLATLLRRIFVVGTLLEMIYNDGKCVGKLYSLNGTAGNAPVVYALQVSALQVSAQVFRGSTGLAEVVYVHITPFFPTNV